MLLTVSVCTWNRSALLQQALEQMTHLVIPPGVDWELLVVNNNCTDATDTVIAAFASRLPIRRLFEANPGQSNARNLAVREARGEYIVWTDDDVLVDENWIASYVQAFQRWPEAAFFGGLVRPWFSVPPPRWLERVWPRIASTYATRDLGDQPLRFEGGNCIPYGANFVVRLKEQRRHLYDPRIGLKPGGNIRGDEVSVLNALLAEGLQGWWVPAAVVRHYIPPERMSTRYIRQYYSGYGEYLAMTEPPCNGPTLFGKPRWLWRQAVTAEVKYRLHRLTSPPDIWIHHLIDASMAWGAFSVDRS
jgi:glycosyltransferase involved in cell wall biosynthesis